MTGLEYRSNSLDVYRRRNQAPSPTGRPEAFLSTDIAKQIYMPSKTLR